MKNIIVTTALALAISSPAFSADLSKAQEYFAQFNESAREQVVISVAEVPTRGPASSATIFAAETLAHDDSRDGRVFFGGNVSTGAGKAQMAAQLDVNPNDFTINELFAMVVDAETDGL